MLFSRNFFYFCEICLYTHKHTRKLSFSRKLVYFRENYFIVEKFVFTHTHKHWRNIIIFAKIIVFSRITSLHKHTKIREISSLSQKYFIFVNIILFSRKLFYFREIHLDTNTQTIAKYRLFRENYFIFAKFIHNSRNLIKHKHTQTSAIFS